MQRPLTLGKFQQFSGFDGLAAIAFRPTASNWQ
jgi:hypothetical protein